MARISMGCAEAYKNSTLREVSRSVIEPDEPSAATAEISTLFPTCLCPEARRSHRPRAAKDPFRMETNYISPEDNPWAGMPVAAKRLASLKIETSSLANRIPVCYCLILPLAGLRKPWRPPTARSVENPTWAGAGYADLRTNVRVTVFYRFFLRWVNYPVSYSASWED